GADRPADRGDPAAHAAHQAPGDQAPELGLDLVGRRGRRQRGQGRAARGRRVPARLEALQAPRGQGPEGHPPARPARHRQDSAGQGRRARVERQVLRPVGIVVRRDVRRPWSGPHPPPLPHRPQAGPGHHLHRRARRRRRDPRQGHLRREGPDPQPAPGRDGRLRQRRQHRRHRRLQHARQARSRAAAPGPLRSPGLRLPARPDRPRGDPARALGRQAAGRRRPRAGGPPDQRARRRRPREHLQRGGDLRGPGDAGDHPDGGLRGGARARRRGHAVPAGHQRPREAGDRLPRGEPRPVLGAPGRRRARAQDLDRPARASARLHAQPARGGPLPQGQGGADRAHDRAAGRARGRARGLRPDHHRRLRRPQARVRAQPLDDRRVRHGHRADVAAAARRRLLGLRRHAPPRRRRAEASDRPGLAPRARRHRRAPTAARRAGLHPARAGGPAARGHRAHRRRRARARGRPRRPSASRAPARAARSRARARAGGRGAGDGCAPVRPVSPGAPPRGARAGV
ncbi:MAG: Cell division protein FtsH, partial [uncultured Solirubrobacterales bacterium]